jgi:hypothetical protein
VCTKAECQRNVGKWIHFRTPYGYHQGIIERISGNQAIIVSPRQYVPVQLASTVVSKDELQRLDVALAADGPGWGGYPGGAYGGGYGRPGPYGRGFGFGWSRWAVSFLIIYLLWGLFW